MKKIGLSTSQAKMTFIRHAYYGGHTDVYKPYGENLYYYDVNSLYPFIMRNFPMPGGVPTWHGNLEGIDLDSMFGFIEAYVECPTTIKKPFLPYRDKNNTLIFPTGVFVGVYYSEELKFANKEGYSIMPLSGYLFENNNSSPFGSFVSTIYERRQEAKKNNNEALSYVYKILMNSLYGRFGINPKCTITEICDEERYQKVLEMTGFIKGDKISDNNYIAVYWQNTDDTPDSDWSPPRISAVQLAAAITACARIHMYPFISRPDSYYTDTDSVVLGNPLPDDVISQTELGKFKLEYIGKKNYFLAPKCYCIITDNDDKIIKHKGLGKSLVDEKWFDIQLADITKKGEKMPVDTNFRIDWKNLEITKKTTNVILGIKENNKRIFTYQNEKWVGTEPINIPTDYAGKEKKILEYKLMIQNKELCAYKDELSKMASQIKNMEFKLGKINNENKGHLINKKKKTNNCQ